ncbi:regulatory factor, effector binding domain-containing protein [Dunaliella salina]|uniref:Regulatory factor, effector binding domain-containing protein n=1 Tax=Dunaliella salina TaxID=3046 RepID=A0ABQ7H2B2_DUNSA|nr:regulatory factor, effector binding domain-containing protein [Dunaliella salina]|eukprot:KAF5840983.1 regulatory factor, effector binding domain-containing protein [Dunaliella salina]
MLLRSGHSCLLSQRPAATNPIHHAAASTPRNPPLFRGHKMSLRGRPVCSAATTEQEETALQASQKPAFDINERVEFLKEDLKHLFDGKGITASAYDDVVEFRDPITQYDNLQGYLFNIQMLKQVFDPVIEMHDIRAIGPYAVLTRWTMTMFFIPARLLPIPFKPTLQFTGTSTYGFNPENGRINKHIDTWDSINNQKFFSPEAAADVFRQLTDVKTTPQSLEQPQYRVIRRAADYQIRRYDPFVVAQTFMDGVKASGSTTEPAEFVNPAGWWSGNSVDSGRLDTTTLPPPQPGVDVTLRKESMGTVAARAFTGLAFPGEVEEQAKELFAALKRDNVPFDESSGWRLARYNDPGTLPPLRRNEVMVKLADNYDPLWAPGELEAFTANFGKHATA